MKPFEIFKVGTQISSSGNTLDFTEDELINSVRAYNDRAPLDRAPITIGHPRDNLPAYGWIPSIDYADQIINATPDQVNADFEEMVRNGSFKNRSASFYTPNSPNNPVPGTYYLRHVAFLGAQPPAVKGLSPVEFAEDDEFITIEFGEVDPWTISRVIRNLREFLIEKFSKEDADNVIPAYMAEDMEDAARTPPKTPAPNSDFNEPEKGTAMADPTPEDQLKDLQAKLEAEIAKNAGMQTQLAEFSEQAQKNRKEKITGQISTLVTAGRITPAIKDDLLQFCEKLGSDVIDFGENDKTPAAEKLIDLLNKLPVVVDYRERSGGDGENDTQNVNTAEEFAEAIQDEMRAAADKGVNLSYDQALMKVKAKRAQQ